MATLRILAETTELSADQVAVQTRLIYGNLLKESHSVDGGNFTAIHPLPGYNRASHIHGKPMPWPQALASARIRSLP